MPLNLRASLALVALSCALAACHDPKLAVSAGPSALSASAVSQSAYITGTLCSGGFECQWAPAATQLDVQRWRLDARAQKGAISKADAQHVQDALSTAHLRLQHSKDECGFDAKGNCTQDLRGAFEDLQLADTSLQTARLTLDAAPLK